MKKILFAILFSIVMACPLMAHEAAYQTDVTNLTARLDALEGRLNSQSSTIDAIYELLDQLKARIDSGEASWNQNAAIDDLYELIDKLRAALTPEEEIEL